MVAEILGDLVVYLFLDDFDLFEAKAVNIGVHQPSGSNWGFPSMCPSASEFNPNIRIEFAGELDGTKGFGDDDGKDANINIEGDDTNVVEDGEDGKDNGDFAS